MPLDLSSVTPPLPPDELVDRVTPGVSAAHAEAAREAFLDTGRRSVGDIERALASVGANLLDFESVLEFGCGCGRILLWLEELGRNAALHGTDIDADAIAWNRENIPFVTFNENDPEPPLPYDDAQFDLVFNHSVLTHLDARYQDLWLAELRRVVKPGGLVILTVHGEAPFEVAERDASRGGDDVAGWRTEVESNGILFIAEDSYVGSTFPDFYHSTYHAPWYVFEHWSSFLDVRAYIPRGDLDHQDIIVLQRPADGVARPQRPIRARPDGARASDAAPAATDTPDRPLDRARSAVEHLPAPLSSSRFGALGSAARNGLFRVLRPYLASRRETDRSLIAALDELNTRAAHIRMPPLVKDILDRQSERVGRVDDALRKDLAAHEERLAALEAEKTPPTA